MNKSKEFVLKSIWQGTIKGLEKTSEKDIQILQPIDITDIKFPITLPGKTINGHKFPIKIIYSNDAEYEYCHGTYSICNESIYIMYDTVHKCLNSIIGTIPEQKESSIEYDKISLFKYIIGDVIVFNEKGSYKMDDGDTMNMKYSCVLPIQVKIEYLNGL